jgi:hypothetical protein
MPIWYQLRAAERKVKQLKGSLHVRRKALLLKERMAAEEGGSRCPAGTSCRQIVRSGKGNGTSLKLSEQAVLECA